MKTVTVGAGLDGVKKRKAHVLGHDLRTQLELKIMLWPAHYFNCYISIFFRYSAC